jgi:DNA repair exonuclease SbcCD nuclease subunit
MDEMITKKPDFDVWLLIGNHDMYHKETWDVNSVKPLSAIPGIHIIDEPSTITFGGRQIDFCPHTENPIAELAKLKAGRSKDSLTLLMGHMAVHGAKLNRLYGTKSDVIVEYDGDLQPVSVDVFDDWDMTLLGHYHGAQQLNDKVEYVGSPLQLSFGEAFEEKHVLLLDLETLEKEYIPNTFSPVHYIITPEDVPTYNLKDNFVRIVLDGVDEKGKVDLRREILANHEVASLDFKEKEKKIEEDEVIIDDAKANLLNEEEMMENYVKDNPPPAELDVKKLLSKGMFICNMSGGSR